MALLTASQIVPGVALVAHAAVVAKLSAAQVVPPTAPAPADGRTPRIATAGQRVPDVLTWACVGGVYPRVTRPPLSRTLVITPEVRTLIAAA